MQVKKGTFTAATSTGDQVVSGLGFTPKGLLIWTSYQTASGFSDGQLFQLGLADGTRQNTAYARSDDSTAPNDTDRHRSTTEICVIRSLAGTNVRVGTLSAFASGQFTLNWSTVDATAAIFHYLAFGGDDLSCHVDAFSIDDFILSATVSFVPQVAIYAHTAAAGDACNFPNLGWAAKHSDGTIGQGSLATNVEDAQVTSDTWRYQRTNRCSSILTAASGVLFNDLATTQMGLEYQTFGGGAVFAHVLFLGGVRAFATSGLQPTAPGTQAITGAGFTPKVGLYASVGQTAQTTVQTEMRCAFGAADASTQGWEWVGNLDAQSPSITAGGHDASHVLVAATPTATGASSTIQAQASQQSLDNGGATLDWDTADATQREYLALLIGDAASASGSGLTWAPLSVLGAAGASFLRSVASGMTPGQG